MIHPILFLMGSYRIRIPREDVGRILNLCKSYGIVYRGLVFEEEGARLDCSPMAGRRLFREARAREIPISLGELRGLPGEVWRLRFRFGIILGLMLCLVITLWSEGILFQIRVDGNRMLSDEAVIEELERCGFSVGDSLKGLDTSILENRILIASEDIAWISINLRGNVAHVVIRERVVPNAEEDYAAANLVAACPGVIEWMEEIRGEPVVEVGDAVGAGDLLVSGILGKEGGPLRLTVASGRVIARTDRRFEIRIPLSYEKKVYTGVEKCEKYLIFFKKEVKFFANTGNLSATCDTIERVETFGLSGEHILPLGIRTVTYLEYRTEEAARSADAAEELAYYRLRLEMEGAVPDGMLVKKTLHTELTDEEFILRCDAEYSENIAKPVKIEVEGAMLPWRRNDTNYGND